MTLLATYIQISDLHIGELDPTTGNARTAPDVKRLASTYRIWHGSLGHQARSLRYLQRYIEGLSKDGEPFTLIVTGDYTRCGHPDELALANQYVTSQIDLQPPRRFFAGLQIGGLQLGVPGNHDHWGGYNTPASTADTAFPKSDLYPTPGFPYVFEGPALLGRQLVFISINSDADVLPGSLRRALAHGDFLSQLKALDWLDPNTANELRILIIHHARHVTGSRLRMTSASRAALDAFLHSHGVQVVLSGHTHKAHTAPVANVLELCSASTTQIDKAPAGWATIWGTPPIAKFERNGFLVHRLHDDGGTIRWDVHGMVRSRQGKGFQEAFRHPFRV